MASNHVISFDGGLKLSPRKGGSHSNSSRRSNRTRSARELQSLHGELHDLQRAFLETKRRSQQRKLLKVQLNKLEADIRLKFFEFEEDQVVHNQQRAIAGFKLASPPQFVPSSTPRTTMPALPRPPGRPVGGVIQLDSLPTMGSPDADLGAAPEVPYEEESTDGTLPVANHMSETHAWTSSPCQIYEIRTANYMKKKKKYTPQQTIFELVGLDAFKYPSDVDIPASNDWDDSVFMRAKRNHTAAGTAMPRYMIVTYITPGEPKLNLSMYFAEKPFIIETEEDERYKKLLDHFLEGDNDKFRKSRFKLIPQCTKGPWMVKKAMGSPALIAKKLDTQFYRGDGFLEVSIDVGSSMIAKRILGTVRGALTGLVLDLGFTIEGKSAEELPERLIGGVRLQHIEIDGIPLMDERYGKIRRKNGKVVI